MKLYSVTDCAINNHMKYIVLGRSSLRVSEICLGAMTFGESTEGIDVTMYGTNANDLLLWDASENALIVT